MKKLLKYLFTEVTPEEQRWSPINVAWTLFLLAVALEIVTGFPVRYLLLLLLVVTASPLMLLLVLGFAVGALVFASLSIHILLPFKEPRRKLLERMRNKFLVDNETVRDFEAEISVLYLLGSVVFVIGVSTVVAFTARDPIQAMFDETGSTLIVAFGSFLLQIILMVLACLVLFCKETKRVWKTLLGS